MSVGRVAGQVALIVEKQCIFISFISLVVATTAAVFEQTLQSAVDMKSENDLTV